MNVQFGGQLPTILEPMTGVQLHPRCTGNANVLGALDVEIVKAGIIKHLGLQIEQAMNLGQTFQQASGSSLGSAASASASAELKTSVQITLLNITISDEEKAALRGDIATANTTAAPAVLAPGSRVIATWEDGRSGPATIRSFNGTQYEIAWDGATTTVWVPAPAVRPA